eukprot:scaffold2710_cov168-Skeletonema_marinoi.AAC.5
MKFLPFYLLPAAAAASARGLRAEVENGENHNGGFVPALKGSDGLFHDGGSALFVKKEHKNEKKSASAEPSSSPSATNDDDDGKGWTPHWDNNPVDEMCKHLGVNQIVCDYMEYLCEWQQEEGKDGECRLSKHDDDDDGLCEYYGNENEADCNELSFEGCYWCDEYPASKCVPTEECEMAPISPLIVAVSE